MAFSGRAHHEDTRATKEAQPSTVATKRQRVC